MITFNLIPWILYMSFSTITNAAENDCEDPENHPVCLHGGDNEAEGNVYVDGLPVCDDEWDKIDADVVCKQLGYTRGALQATSASLFGQVGVSFSMDDVACSGTEDKIKSCKHEEREDCGVQEAAGVVCDAITPQEEVKDQELTEDCFAREVGYKSEGAMSGLRKVSSAMHCQQWCADSQNCLHFTFHLITKSCQRYSVISANNKIKKDSVVSGPRECLQNKSMILDNSYCQTTVNKTICLRNADNLTHAGNVFVNGQPICDDNWSMDDGTYFCNVFGYHGIRKNTTMSYFGLVPATFANLDDEGGSSFGCDSSEGAGVICDTRDRDIIDREKDCFIANLIYSDDNKLDFETNAEYADDCQRNCLEIEDCSHFSWFPEDDKCTVFNRNEMDEGKIKLPQVVSGPRICSNDHSVEFDSNENCNEEDAICLVGGSSHNEGNVFVGGKPVCDDGWSILNAHIACKQKGFIRALEAKTNSRFGNVPKVFGLDNVQCSGEETKLSNCTHSSNEDCEGFEGAGVICDTRNKDEIMSSQQDLSEKCFAENVLYGKLLNGELVYVPSTADCQQYCQQDSLCQLFSYNNKTGECNKRKHIQTEVSLKLDANDVPYLLIGSKWMPICGHYFWDNNIGADIVCQNLGFSQGGVIHRIRGQYNKDAYYVGRCDSKSITDLENGCTKEVLAAQYSCKKGRPVSIKVKCRGSPDICNINPSDRVECGWAGISRSLCENRGCCFSDSIPHAKWCFQELAGRSSGGVATLSSSHNTHIASNCIDGDINTFCHSLPNESYPYFAMAYPEPVLIKKVKIIARRNCCWDRVKQLVISVTNVYPVQGELVSEAGSSTHFGNFPGPAHSAQVITFTFQGGIRGRYVVVQQEYNGTLNFAEVQVETERYLSHVSMKGKKIESSTRDIISGPLYCPLTSPVLKYEHCKEPESVCLVGGSTHFEGNVYFGGNPICDDQWNLNSAQIVCKQLGFGLAKNMTLNSQFGNVEGPFSIANVECLGTEERIVDCSHNEFPQCLGNEAAGAICESENERLIREDKESKMNECFIEDTCYTGYNPHQNRYKLVYSAKECQEHCEENQGCTHFSYHKDTWHCFFSSSETKTHCSNVISGPKNCDQVDLAINLPEDDLCRKEGQLCLCPKENGKMTSKGNVFVGGKPVCDDSWGLVDAEVVCRQLQFHGVSDVTSRSHFGYVSGTFAMDDVECTGAETNITECDHKKKDNCDGGEAAGVVCDLRDKESIEKDKKQIKNCFMEDVEYGGISLILYDIITDNVTACHEQCINEANCMHFTFSTESHKCMLYEGQLQGKRKKSLVGSYTEPKLCVDNDTIVKIKDDRENCTGPTDLCLEGRPGNHEGNVFWGGKPVCDDGWDFVNANVVCKQLGLSHALEFKTESHFGNVSMTFSLDDVSCHGNETSLNACRHTTNENCDGTEAAGVICDMRNETDNETSACFAENITIGSILPVQRGTKQVQYVYLPSSVDCQKWCQHKELCGFFSFETESQKCYLRKDTQKKYQREGFVSGPKKCVSNTVELSNNEGDNCSQTGVACVGGGTGPHEGNVYIGGRPVCDEAGAWGMTNAHVFCKQMGYRRAKQFTINSFFGNVTGPFFATNVRCVGNEKSIGACQFVPRANCLKMEAVGVVCETHREKFYDWETKQKSYTCFEMDTRYSGTDIVNANINGHGEMKDTVGDCQTACQEHSECQYFIYFTEKHPFIHPAFINHPSYGHKNLCRMLRVKGKSEHGKSNVISGPKQCRPCKKFDEFGKCKKYIEKECYKTGEICLIGGSNAREGNILVGGKPVCDDSWDKIDADVACKQLGFLGALNATIKSRFGRVPFDFGMDDVTCTGSEVELHDCKHESDNHDCSQREGAGVICRPNEASSNCFKENVDCCIPKMFVHDFIHDSNTLYTEGGHFKPENVLRDDCDNFDAIVPSKTTYWLAPSNQTGGYIIVDLGCRMVINKITLKNTHNGKHNDRGLSNFTISLSNSTVGPWNVILKDQLKDVRNLRCSVPLEIFSLTDRVELNRTGQFVKLEVDSYYGMEEAFSISISRGISQIFPLLEALSWSSDSVWQSSW